MSNSRDSSPYHLHLHQGDESESDSFENSAGWMAMETTAVTLPLFLRTNRFDKRPYKVLNSVCDELLSLQTRIESENCGEGIEATTSLANELASIQKRIYDLLEDVQTLEVSKFRREAMNQTEGIEEVVQQVEESEETVVGAVMQPVALKLMPSEGWSWWRSKEKKPRPVIKKLKQ